MGYPVILTPQSQEDLAAIVQFIALDNPDSARTYGNLLIDKALSLSSLPEMGRVVPELGDATVREIIHSPYRIIYEVLQLPATVFILRFWHASRGVPQIRKG